MCIFTAATTDDSIDSYVELNNLTLKSMSRDK
jgi:hypothetical protein